MRKNDPRVAVAFRLPCDRMLAVSKAAQDAACRLRPGVASRLLYNGTPMRDVSSEEARAARVEFGAREDDVVVGVFGRLQRNKAKMCS